MSMAASDVKCRYYGSCSIERITDSLFCETHSCKHVTDERVRCMWPVEKDNDGFCDKHSNIARVRAHRAKLDDASYFGVFYTTNEYVFVLPADVEQTCGLVRHPEWRSGYRYVDMKQDDQSIVRAVVDHMATCKDGLEYRFVKTDYACYGDDGGYYEACECHDIAIEWLPVRFRHYWFIAYDRVVLNAVKLATDGLAIDGYAHLLV